jgi:predicted nucleic acid-binding protein
MKRILVDTSFLVSLINPREERHADCARVATQIVSHKQWIVPQTVLTETTYMLDKWLGHHVMRSFVARMNRSDWDIRPIQASDLQRCEELLEQYADSRLDFVDSTLVALSEQLDIDTILTLDRRHFYMIRPKHIPHFTILPE